jgi:environmental stress-induced protein Ves
MNLVTMRWADRSSMLWKNGLGTTHEIVRWPAGSGDDFDWRVSVADVTVDSQFSAFAGVDRILMMISGNGMSLTLGSEERQLPLFEPFEFSGDVAVSSHLTNGPTRDLNVMTRRSRFTAEVAILDVSHEAVVSIDDASVDLLLLLTGDLAAGTETEPTATALEPLDLLWPQQIQKRQPVTLQGDGAVAWIAIRPLGPAGASQS